MCTHFPATTISLALGQTWGDIVSYIMLPLKMNQLIWQKKQHIVSLFLIVSEAKTVINSLAQYAAADELFKAFWTLAGKVEKYVTLGWEVRWNLHCGRVIWDILQKLIISRSCMFSLRRYAASALPNLRLHFPLVFFNHGVSRGRTITPWGLTRRDIDTAGREWAENVSLLVDCKIASHHAPEAQMRRLPLLWFYSLMLWTPTHS